MTLDPGLLPWSLRVTGVRAVLSSKGIRNLSSKPWTLAWQGWSLGGAPTVYICTYMYMYMNYVHVYAYVCVNIYTYIYIIYTYIHIYIYVYIYGPCGRPFPPPSQSPRVPHTKRRAAEEPGRRVGGGEHLSSILPRCAVMRAGRGGRVTLN